MENYEYTRHDRVVNKGFYVHPEQLAHDLALIKLSKITKLTEHSSNDSYYFKYIELLDDFRFVIDDKCRYDANFHQD